MKTVHLRTGAHARPRPPPRPRRTQGAKFIAGGTNLLDLMKLEIETPTHLIDVNGLGARQDRADAGRRPAHRRAGAQHRPRCRPARAARLRACCRAPCSPAPRASCATRRRPRATCCSARAAPISTTPTSRATSACPAAAARRSAASAASTPSSAPATPASRRIPATWRSRCASLDATVETMRPDGSARSIPIADFHRLPGNTPHVETTLEPRRTDHGGDAAQAGRRRARLSQGARPRVVRLRAGLRRGDRAARRQRAASRSAASRTSRGASRRPKPSCRAAPRRLPSGCSPARARRPTTPSSCRWSSAPSPPCSAEARSCA